MKAVYTSHIINQWVEVSYITTNYEHPEISLNCIQTTKTTAHDALQQTSILYII